MAELRISNTDKCVCRQSLALNMKRKSKVTTCWRNPAAEAQTSVVGKTKSVFWRWGQSFTSSSCQPTAKRLCTVSLQPNKVSLDHTLSFTLSFFHSLSPLCSAYYHHAARRGWFKTYTFRFKKLMLGLGWVIIFSSTTQWRIRAKIKKAGELNAPLILRFTDKKLKWKHCTEINIFWALKTQQYMHDWQGD